MYTVPKLRLRDKKMPKTAETTSSGQSRNFFKFKKVKVLLVAAIVLVLAVAASLFGWYNVRASNTKKSIQASLHELSQQSDLVTTYQRKDPSSSDLEDFSAELSNLSQLIKDKKYQASQFPRN